MLKGLEEGYPVMEGCVQDELRKQWGWLSWGLKGTENKDNDKLVTIDMDGIPQGEINTMLRRKFVLALRESRKTCSRSSRLLVNQVRNKQKHLIQCITRWHHLVLLSAPPSPDCFPRFFKITFYFLISPTTVLVLVAGVGIFTSNRSRYYGGVAK